MEGFRDPIARTPDGPGLFVALAPMDGVTDWVYRALMTDLAGGQSGISICVSEFVRVTQHKIADRVIVRHCPEVRSGGRTRAGTPVFVQLLGGDWGPMADTAAAAVALGAPGIDLNFGCPAKTVNRHDGGATILKTPSRITSITEAVRRAVPAQVPVTVKVRLGWDSATPVADIARAAEAGGASWLTIHARTRLQLYKPPVDWKAIGRARRAVDIPVVANGDLGTPADIARCGAQSGCNAFMVGRGAMARPLLFRRLRGIEERDLDLPWLASVWLDYITRLLAAGATDRVALGRVKQWLRLAAPAFSEVHAMFGRLKRTADLAQVRTALQTLAGGADGAHGTPAPAPHSMLGPSGYGPRRCAT